MISRGQRYARRTSPSSSLEPDAPPRLQTFDALDQWWAMLRDIVPADARPEFIVVGTHADNDDRRGVTQKRVQRWMEHRSLHVRQAGRAAGLRGLRAV